MKKIILIFFVCLVGASDKRVKIELSDKSTFLADSDVLRVSKIIGNWLADSKDYSETIPVNQISPELFKKVLYPLMQYDPNKDVDKRQDIKNRYKNLNIKSRSFDARAHTNLLNFDQIKELTLASDYYDIPTLLPLFLNRCVEILTSEAHLKRFSRDPELFMAGMDIPDHLADMIANSLFMKNRIPYFFSTNPIYTNDRFSYSIIPAFSPDNNHIIMGNSESISVLNSYTGGKEYAFSAKNEGLDIKDVTFSTDGTRFAVKLIHFDKTSPNDNETFVDILDTHTGEILASYDFGRRDVSRRMLGITFSSDGNKIAFRFPREINVFDMNSQAKIFSSNLPSYSKDAAFSPDSKRLVVALDDTLFKIFDFNGGQVEADMPKKNKSEIARINKIRFDSTGKHVVGLSRGGCFVWDSQTGQLDWSKPYPKAPAIRNYPSGGYFFPDGSKIVAVSEEGLFIASVFPKSPWQEITESKLPYKYPNTPTAISFSFDGKLLAAGSDIGIIKLWNTKTNELLRTIDNRIEDRPLDTIEMSPFGDLLVTVSGNRVIRMWQTFINPKLSLETELTFLALSDKKLLPRDVEQLRQFADKSLESIKDEATKKILRGYFDGRFKEVGKK